MLASGARVRRFKPDRSRWIFRASEKSPACLPSERKWKKLSHVPALLHVKEPSTSVNYECASKIPCIVPSFASRGLSCLYGAWRLWRWLRGNQWYKGTIGLQAAVPKKPHTRPFLHVNIPSFYLVLIGFNNSHNICKLGDILNYWYDTQNILFIKSLSSLGLSEI